MGSKEWHARENSSDRKGQKRKLEHQPHELERETAVLDADAIRREVSNHVDVLRTKFSCFEADRAAARRATHGLAELAKNGTIWSSLDNLNVLRVEFEL